MYKQVRNVERQKSYQTFDVKNNLFLSSVDR